MMSDLLLALHLLGAVLWVGGMAFALFVLRPAAHEVLRRRASSEAAASQCRKTPGSEKATRAGR